MTVTTCRPVRLPEEVLEDGSVELSHRAMVNAVEDGSIDDLLDAYSRLIEDLTGLAEEFPEDWGYLVGSQTPAAAAGAHLAHLACLQA
jgi:hypothetical protein